MEYWEIFAAKIVEASEKLDISVTQLAKLSNVPQGTLDSIIHGRSKNPKISTLHHIANALGLTVSEFLDFPELNDYEFPEDEP